MNSQYNFKEAQLKSDFASKKMAEVKKLIQNATSFTILGMPGVGVSYFLRFLASSNLAHFVFVDSFALATHSKQEYLGWLLHELGGEAKNLSEQQIYEQCKIKLQELTAQHKKVVIIFNRFDQLLTSSSEFDTFFLANLRSLKMIDPDKIVMIFTANKPLYEICPDAIIGSNINFYSQLFYFGTYTENDLQNLLRISGLNTGNPQVKQIISLSGGHNQLFHIILKSESQNPIQDRFVKLQFKEIYDSLDIPNKKTVQKIAQGKTPSVVDAYLIHIGIVTKAKEKYRLFTPLFEEYIRSYTMVKIPAKEGKLFKLLSQNLGKVVLKDDIFNYLWKDDADNASDWALNALIYRLRKNPKFTSQGYMIENHKKIGYVMTKL